MSDIGTDRPRVSSLFDRSSVFRDGVGMNSGVEAALMFNSSLFVLIRGNPGLPLGVSVCRRPRVCCCCCAETTESATGKRQDKPKSEDDSDEAVYLPNCHASVVNSQSTETEVISLFNN